MSSMSPFERNDGDEGTNRSAPVRDCKTCGGDKFVTVRLRKPQMTMWMREHQHPKGHQPHVHETEMHEEVAPCPDCNPTVVEYYRTGQPPFRSMDAAQTREALAE